MMPSMCPRPPHPQKRSLFIERHHRVATLPHPRRKRIAPIPNPHAQRPYADHAVQLAMRRRQPSRHTIRVVHNRHRSIDIEGPQPHRQQLLHPCALQLRQVWSLFHHAVLDQARYRDSHR